MNRVECPRSLLVPSLLYLLFLLCPPLMGQAQENQPLPPHAPVESAAQEEAGQAHMAWWREARFGLFIHWGPVSLKGTEIGWSRKGPRHGHGSGEAKSGVPVEIYDNLYKEFNPTRFNGDEWARIAKAAGMQYVVFTTKHHDGFVNFDSALTDYKITSPASPYGRDVVAELTDACRKAGLKMGYYYSQPDWRHPDYRTERHARYIQYLHGQVEELLTNYGRIDLIWFDGLGGKEADWEGTKLFRKIKALQPHVLINNRCGLPGNYDTPEQRIGAFQKDRPWETCMTLCRQWAWKPDDNMKSLQECIHTLVRVVGGDGNLLLNVGPMPDGRIEPRQVARLAEMGQWLDRYGESIYGTRGGPFMPEAWGASTCKGHRIYVHVLNWPGEVLHLPPIDGMIEKASLLTGGALTWNQTAKGIEVKVAREHRCEPDTLLVLEMDRPAHTITPVSMGICSLTHGKKGEASNVFQGQAEYGPDKALDNNPATRWATDSGTQQASLTVNLGESLSFNQAVITEAYSGRIRKFELQYRSGEEWTSFYSGQGVGDCATLSFPPVKAQEVRLLILEASEGPTLWEFQLFDR